MYLVFGFKLTAAVFAGVAFIVGAVWGWFTGKTDEDIDYKYNKHDKNSEINMQSP